MQGGRLLENLNLVEGFPVADTNGGKTSDWISVQSYKRVVVVFAAGAGTGDSIITLNQAKDIAGGSSKALNFTTFYHKTATTDLSAVANWTKVTQAAGNTATVAAWANKSKLCVIELHAEEFDFANSVLFPQRRALGRQRGDARVRAVPAGEARYPCAPEAMLTAIS
jgi:hypothetical protein